MQRDAENNERRATRHNASSRVEARCADEGYNEIESDAEIAAEQRSADDQSNRDRGREMRRGKSRRARQADAEYDENRAMPTSRAEQQSADDQAEKTDAERRTIAQTSKRLEQCRAIQGITRARRRRATQATE